MCNISVEVKPFLALQAGLNAHFDKKSPLDSHFPVKVNCLQYRKHADAPGPEGTSADVDYPVRCKVL